MNQDTHLYIEANQKHGRGYQVHIVIDGIVDSTMADEPFSLYDALGGAQFTLEAVNKERGTNYLLPDVLLVSREAAMAERQTDFLSAKLLRENSSKTGPWLTIREKAAAGGLHHGLRGDLSCVCRRTGGSQSEGKPCLHGLLPAPCIQALWRQCVRTLQHPHAPADDRHGLRMDQTGISGS